VMLLFATATVAWTLHEIGTRMIEAVSPRVVGQPAVRFVSLMFVLSTSFLIYRNHYALDGAFTLAPLPVTLHAGARPPAPHADLVTDGFSADAPMLRAMMAGREVVRCNEPLQLPGAIDPQRDIVFSDGRASISEVVFSPNRVGFRALPSGTESAKVFLNQRYVRGWNSSLGPLRLDPATGLAYAELPPTRAGRFAFTFTPPRLIPGLMLAAVGLAAATALWRRRLAPVVSCSDRSRAVIQS
jgi:hypothetical protein